MPRYGNRPVGRVGVEPTTFCFTDKRSTLYTVNTYSSLSIKSSFEIYLVCFTTELSPHMCSRDWIRTDQPPNLNGLALYQLSYPLCQEQVESFVCKFRSLCCKSSQSSLISTAYLLSKINLWW